MEEIRQKTLNALYGAIESSSVKSDDIMGLLSIISKRYLYTFMSNKVTEAVLKDIYNSNRQDEYLEFISEFHSSLILEGLTNDQLVDIAASSCGLFQNSPVDKEIQPMTNGGLNRPSVFSSVLFILRMNMKYAFNYLMKKEEENVKRRIH